MDGDRPRELEGELRVRPHDLAAHRPVLDDGTRGLPGERADVDHAPVAELDGHDRDVAAREIDVVYPPEAAVRPAVRSVVRQQHHLGADLEPHRVLDGRVEE